MSEQWREDAIMGMWCARFQQGSARIIAKWGMRYLDGIVAMWVGMAWLEEGTL